MKRTEDLFFPIAPSPTQSHGILLFLCHVLRTHSYLGAPLLATFSHEPRTVIHTTSMGYGLSPSRNFTSTPRAALY